MPARRASQLGESAPRLILRHLHSGTGAGDLDAAFVELGSRGARQLERVGGSKPRLVAPPLDPGDEPEIVEQSSS